MSRELSLRSSRMDGACVVLVDGEIDMLTAPELAEFIAELDDVDHVIVDLGLVPAIDSSGFAALFDAHERLAGQGRQLTIRGVRPGPMRLMRVTRLDTQFHLENAAGAHPVDEVAIRIARLRRLYDDLAGEFDNFEHHRELWARIGVEQQALSDLQSTEFQPVD